MVPAAADFSCASTTDRPYQKTIGCSAATQVIWIADSHVKVKNDTASVRMVLKAAKVLLLLALCAGALTLPAFGLGQERYVSTSPQPSSFGIVQGGRAAAIYVDSRDYSGVIRAAGDLKNDIALVTGVAPAIQHSKKDLRSPTIIVG